MTINNRACVFPATVAPVRERGLKLVEKDKLQDFNKSRSRKGAWIEIKKRRRGDSWISVAPVRERGLKSDMFS